jgi:hypothetical protein
MRFRAEMPDAREGDDENGVECLREVGPILTRGRGPHPMAPPRGVEPSGGEGKGMGQPRRTSRTLLKYNCPRRNRAPFSLIAHAHCRMDAWTVLGTSVAGLSRKRARCQLVRGHRSEDTVMRRIVIYLDVRGEYVVELLVERLGKPDRIADRAVFANLPTARALAVSWSQVNNACPVEDVTAADTE